MEQILDRKVVIVSLCVFVLMNEECADIKGRFVLLAGVRWGPTPKDPVCWLCSSKTNGTNVNVKGDTNWKNQHKEKRKDLFLYARTHTVYSVKQEKQIKVFKCECLNSQREMAPHVLSWTHSLIVIPWQKCVTSTCFDGTVYWAEDGNGVGYIYTHMPRTQHSA